MQKPTKLKEAKALDKEATKGPWAIDKLILTYLAATSVLEVIFCAQIPQAWWLLLLKVAGVGLIVVARRSETMASWLFRNWYPAIYVAACYKELNYLIPALRSGTADAALARFDLATLRVNPTVWIERLQMPLLTEYLQIVYSLFIPAVLLVAYLLWRQRRLEEFRFYGFLISMGYLVSYVFYFLVPARGPRFLLSQIQHTQLEGLWTFNWFRNLLDNLEGIHYDCFPSGHTEQTLLAWWTSQRLSRKVFYIFTIFTASQLFSTVYLRYHYVVDLVAGGVIAAILIFVTPRLYESLKKLRH
ncbi:MAG TPA: phosphatase PAP2 family protein [Pyrinomonadaceae bacterium]|nr:phosphatase PAP2 family protein [Pyrinomonadaceae bacterium]